MNVTLIERWIKATYRRATITQKQEDWDIYNNWVAKLQEAQHDNPTP